MTHKDIYTKFMIEYDKAGASTSYPSLTEYEVATVLDKAYNALIAQKITGNNVRRATFESDIKSIADLGPLVDTKVLEGVADSSMAPNVFKFDTTKYKESIAVDVYFYNIIVDEELDSGTPTGPQMIYWNPVNSKFVIVSMMDSGKYFESSTVESTQETLTYLNGLVTNHTPFYIHIGSPSGLLYKFNGTTLLQVQNDGEEASGYMYKKTNLLYFLQGSMLYYSPTAVSETTLDGTVNHYYTPFVIDDNTTYRPIDHEAMSHDAQRGVPVKLVNHEMAQKFFTSISNIPWIKQPVCFVEGKNLFVVYDLLNPPTNTFRMIYIKQPNTFVKELGVTPGTDGTCSYFSWDETIHTTGAPDSYQFECNSTVAEELVSLAVAFALENVESQRLNSKLNMRGLEA